MPNGCTQDGSCFWGVCVCVCVCVRTCVCVCEREGERTDYTKTKKVDLDKSSKPTNLTLNISLQTSLSCFGEHRSHQGSLILLSFHLFYILEVYILLYTQKVTL